MSAAPRRRGAAVEAHVPGCSARGEAVRLAPLPRCSDDGRPDGANGGSRNPCHRRMAEMIRNLEGIELLAGLPLKARAELVDKCMWTNFTPNEVVVAQDDETFDVYFIVSGSVRVMTSAREQQQVTLAELKTGACFGELSAIDNQARSARVISIEPSLIAKLARNDFRTMLLDHPKVALKLLSNFAGIIRSANVRVTEILGRTPSQRVYGELLRIAEPNPVGDGSWIIAPVPPHNELAAWAATNEAIVASTIGGLVREGIVRRKDRSYFISDYARLRVLSEV